MKRVFLEHMGLIVVAVIWAALSAGCASDPATRADEATATPEQCREVISKVAADKAAGDVAKKSPQKRGK